MGRGISKSREVRARAGQQTNEFCTETSVSVNAGISALPGVPLEAQPWTHTGDNRASRRHDGVPDSPPLITVQSSSANLLTSCIRRSVDNSVTHCGDPSSPQRRSLASRKPVLSQNNSTTAALSLSKGSTREMDMAEIQSCIAASEGRCIILILFGHAYDVTSFLKDHPGGAAILQKYNGQECGEPFMRIHGLRAKTMVEQYHIGRVRGAYPASSSPLIAKRPSLPSGRRPSQRRKTTRVLEVRQSETDPSIRYFTFATPVPLDIIPGGHIKLYQDAEDDCGRFYTPYACGSTSFVICMKHYDIGQVSSYFFSLQEGVEVCFDGPFPPSWVVDTEERLLDDGSDYSQRHLLLLAGGTGVTPLYTIAKHVLTTGTASVTLCCSFTSVDGIVITSELKELLLAYCGCDSPQKRNLRVIFFLTRAEPGTTVSWATHTFTGRLNSDMLRNSIIPMARKAIVCGPSPFNATAVQCVKEAGICAVEHVHIL